jgi:hypothetical protein
MNIKLIEKKQRGDQFYNGVPPGNFIAAGTALPFEKQKTENRDQFIRLQVRAAAGAMGTRKYNGNLFGYSVDTHIKK